MLNLGPHQWAAVHCGAGSPISHLLEYGNKVSQEQIEGGNADEDRL